MGMDSHKELDLSCELRGVVNGVPVTVTGSGKAGPLDGGDVPILLDLDADGISECWDIGLAATGFLDPLMFVAVLRLQRPELLQAEDIDLPIPFGGHWTLLDDGHRELGRADYVGQVLAEDGALRLQAQLAECQTHLEVGERVTRATWTGSSGSTPLGPDSTAITSAWEVETSRGATLRTISTCWVRWGPAHSCSTWMPRGTLDVVGGGSAVQLGVRGCLCVG